MPEDISKGNDFFDSVPTKGRPKKILTAEGLRVIENLSRVQCTDEEIASVIGCSVDVLTNKNNKKAFAEAKEKGLQSGKASIRRMQYKAAEAGNPTMLIWLGKQYLGQTEKQEIETNATQDFVFNILPASEKAEK